MPSLIRGATLCAAAAASLGAPPPPISSNSTTNEQSEGYTGDVSVPVVSAVIIVFLIVLALLIYYWYLRRDKKLKPLIEEDVEEKTEEEVTPVSLPRQYSLTMQHITTPLATLASRSPEAFARSRNSNILLPPPAGTKLRYKFGDRIISLKNGVGKPGRVIAGDPVKFTYTLMLDEGSSHHHHPETLLSDGSPRYAIGARVTYRDAATGQCTIGNVVEATESLYSIRIGGNVKTEVPEARLSLTNRFKEAQQVFYTGNGGMESAVVTRVNEDGSYSILLSESAQVMVKANVSDGTLETRKDFEFEVGMRVYAREGGEDALATAADVVQVLEDGWYSVEFLESKKTEKVPAKWMLPMGNELAVSSRLSYSSMSQASPSRRRRARAGTKISVAGSQTSVPNLPPSHNSGALSLSQMDSSLVSPRSTPTTRHPLQSMPTTPGTSAGQLLAPTRSFTNRSPSTPRSPQIPAPKREGGFAAVCSV
eukprot:Rhum_TRINITY_DN17042_c0_g1::Rhum_TRINITY_DN17042_c0_g1_i1::g.165140::m.165140